MSTMKGTDNYKVFDEAAIVTTSASKDSVSLAKHTFRKRELVLAAVAIGALLAVIMLATQATKSNSCHDDDGVKLAAVTSGNHTGNRDDKNCTGNKDDVSTQHAKLPYCTTIECLKAAVYQKSIVNQGVDPCDDFYTFACGNYKVHHPQTPMLTDVTAENEIMLENNKNLESLLGIPHDGSYLHPYERKLKDFMYSCTNHFDKMDLRGTPLLKHAILPLGGWYVLDTFDPSAFDLQKTVKGVHVELWTNVLFSIFVRTDKTDSNRKIVQIDFGGVGLDFWLYGEFSWNKRIHQIYFDYMRQLAHLLSLDAGIEPSTDRIQTFVNDVFEVESGLAEILLNSNALRNPHAPENLMTLEDLNEHVNNTLDFVDYMKAVFNEWPSKFDNNTKISVTRSGYFDKMGAVLSRYLSTDEGKRKLHNYMMWQVINRYSHDLSWNYVHAKRKLDYDLKGYKDESSGNTYCISMAENSFSKAMSAVFIKRYVKSDGKKAVSAILDRIKLVLKEGIRSLSWITGDDRTTAMKKIEQTLFKIGFPDEFVDDSYMDAIYSLVDIDPIDYFANILNLNKLVRKSYNNLIGKPDTRTPWAYPVYNPVIEYNNPLNELIITAAMFQNPLFNARGPSYYNYGGVGSRLATNLIHAIDEYGKWYNLNESLSGDWWSNTTTAHYMELKQCAIDVQKNEVFGPFTDSTENELKVITAGHASSWAPELLADASGARLAYKAYKQDEQVNGREKLLPGFPNFTPDKMFFLSYAQSYCQNTPDFIKESKLLNGDFPDKNRVNLAIRQIPEFHTAFQCTSASALYSKAKSCLLFN